MGGFKGTGVNKLNGGLGGTNPSEDNIMMLVYVIPSASLPAGQVHYVPKELLQPSDAEALGYDAAFDANESVLIYDEITEYFRIAPEAKLWVMAVPDATTPTAVATHASFLAGVRTASDVNILGFGNFNYTAVQMNTYLEGVQGMVNTLAGEARYIDAVILAGKGDATITAISAYPDNRLKNAPNVTVSIAQDNSVASLDAAYAKYSAIGAVLGGLAVRQVNENLGSVDVINKPDANKADRDYPLNFDTRWADARLSDGNKVANLTTADLTSLTDKGYIFAGYYSGYPGTFFNGSPTSVELASDYAFIERNRTWNKAARLLRTAYMPKIKGILKKDPNTGFIRNTSLVQLKNIGKKVLKRMEDADLISGGDIYINPKQIVNSTTSLKIKAQVVVDDIIHEISIDLGLTNKL